MRRQFERRPLLMQKEKEKEELRRLLQRQQEELEMHSKQAEHNEENLRAQNSQNQVKRAVMHGMNATETMGKKPTQLTITEDNMVLSPQKTSMDALQKKAQQLVEQRMLSKQANLHANMK